MHEDIHGAGGEALCHELEALVIPEEVIIVAEREIVTRCLGHTLISR